MARCGKKRTCQACSALCPHSAPNREMASCGKILEKKCHLLGFDAVVARCGGRKKNPAQGSFPGPGDTERRPRLGALPSPPLGTAWFAQTANPTSAQGLICSGEIPQNGPGACRAECPVGAARTEAFRQARPLAEGQKSADVKYDFTIPPPPPAKYNWRKGSDFPRKMRVLMSSSHHLAERVFRSEVPPDWWRL